MQRETEEASVCEHLNNSLLCQGEHCMNPFYYFRDLKPFEKNLLDFIAKTCWLRILYNEIFVVLDKCLISIHSHGGNHTLFQADTAQSILLSFSLLSNSLSVRKCENSRAQQSSFCPCLHHCLRIKQIKCFNAEQTKHSEFSQTQMICELCSGGLFCRHCLKLLSVYTSRAGILCAGLESCMLRLSCFGKGLCVCKLLLIYKEKIQNFSLFRQRE